MSARTERQTAMVEAQRKKEEIIMDAGWTRIESEEDRKCERMRRARGLVVSTDLNNFDCNECELLHLCEQ